MQVHMFEQLWRQLRHKLRSDSSMFSLCSVPSTCLQNAISSSAKTARPRRGALNSTYWFPVLRLPGSRRALGLATQGLKSHCKRRSGQSRCRENMDLPLLTMWLSLRNMVCLCCIAYNMTLCHIAYNINMTRGLTLCHIAYNINLTRGLTLCHICLHKSLHYAAASAIRPHRTTFVEPRQAADFRSRVARRVRLVSRGSCSG